MSGEAITADLAVIGAGSAGLSVAAGAAQLGLKVVLFEAGEMGGDCLNYGCVPSKALLAVAEAAHRARTGESLGVATTDVRVDFTAAMAHVHRTIAAIAPVDSQARFEGLGVRVVRQAARFTDNRTVASEAFSVRARKIVIATGSRALIPAIPGLDAAPYLTNETVFELTALPQRLVVLGGGPIGVELGQAFARLGSMVTIVEAEDTVLGREDPEAAAVVTEQLRADGVTVRMGAPVVRVETPSRGGIAVIVGTPSGEECIEGSHLLVAVGRTPVLQGLDLERAGAAYTRQGVTTDRSLRSSNPRVYVAGDAAGRGQFTHLAGAHASLVVRRAIFGLPVNANALKVPRVTYCDPEVAAIGMTEAEAREAHGPSIRVERISLHDNDRAQAEGDTRGFGKLVTTRRGGVLGVTLVGRHAGDQIHLWSLILSAGLKLSQVAGMIAPYPTRGEINKRLTGQWFTPALFSPRTRALISVLKHLP